MADKIAVRNIRDLIKDDTIDSAVNYLTNLVGNEEAPHTLRVSAATYLIDQKHGKARQYIEQETKIHTYVDFLDKVIEVQGKNSLREYKQIDMVQQDGVYQAPNLRDLF